MGYGLQALGFRLEEDARVRDRDLFQPNVQSPRPKARRGGAS
jgi:hypothetical protein